VPSIACVGKVPKITEPLNPVAAAAFDHSPESLWQPAKLSIRERLPHNETPNERVRAAIQFPRFPQVFVIPNLDSCFRLISITSIRKSPKASLMMHGV
jgi:hypothetical protein